MPDSVPAPPVPRVDQDQATVFARANGAGGSSLFRWLARRLGAAILVLFAASVAIFVATSILPGDAAQVYLGPRASETQLTALREQMGLDQPLVVQYVRWVERALRGDFGTSLVSGRPIAASIATPARNSLALAGVTMVILVPLSLGLGIASGLRAGSPFDGVLGIVTTVFYAVPMFITASLLIIVFALRLDWLPAVSFLPSGASPFTQLPALVLPVVTLILGSAAYLVRLVRAGVVETMQSDFVEAAWLRGVSRPRLALRHVLPSILPPIVQVLILYCAALFSGVVIVESVFGYPGIGQELVRSISARDIPVVQAIALLSAVIVVGGNVLADTLTIALTPRLRGETWS